MLAGFKKVDLTKEQTDKIKAIVREYGKKLAELRKKAGLSAEQKKARAEASKKAKSEGLKGKARKDFVAKARSSRRRPWRSCGK